MDISRYYSDKRVDHIYTMAETYNVDPFTLFEFADILGEKEDYDGLVCIAQELSCIGD